MTTKITVDPATPEIDSAGIYVGGKGLLMTWIDRAGPEAHNAEAVRVARLLRAADEGMIPELSAIAGRADVPDDVRETARRLAAVATGRARADG